MCVCICVCVCVCGYESMRFSAIRRYFISRSRPASGMSFLPQKRKRENWRTRENYGNGPFFAAACSLSVSTGFVK